MIFNFDFSETYSLKVSFWCIDCRGFDGLEALFIKGLSLIFFEQFYLINTHF